jgi:WD40 repeat protein
VDALAYSPDGKFIATGGTDDTARVWDAATGAQMLVLRGDNGPVDSVSFSPDGRVLATASEDGTARIWNVTPEGSRDWFTIDAHHGGVESVEYSGDGRELLTTGFRDGRGKLWNARTGRLLKTYKRPAQPGAGLIPAGFRSRAAIGATSPDGNLTAEVSLSGTAALYDANGQTVLKLGTAHGGVQAVVFDPEGRRLATGYRDGTVVVWDVASRRSLQTLAAHKGTVDAVAFSPDGRVLATAGEDSTAKLWDLRTGNQLLTLTGHTGGLTAIAFNPSGTRLVTASVDGTARVYVLPVDELLTVARSRLTRGWTDEECRRYLAGARCPKTP